MQLFANQAGRALLHLRIAPQKIVVGGQEELKQGFANCTTSRITQTVSFCNWTRTDEVALKKMHLKNLSVVLFRRLLLQQTDYYLLTQQAVVTPYMG